MTSPTADAYAGRLEGMAPIATDSSPQTTRFLQPAAGRILAGAGLAGGSLQQVLRRHGAAARRIVLGRQILKIVAKSNGSSLTG
jgi:hypothetical protein